MKSVLFMLLVGLILISTQLVAEGVSLSYGGELIETAIPEIKIYLGEVAGNPMFDVLAPPWQGSIFYRRESSNRTNQIDVWNYDFTSGERPTTHTIVYQARCQADIVKSKEGGVLAYAGELKQLLPL